MAEVSKLGRYELRRILGQGAMGVVYEGFDPTLSRRVAVKTILKSHHLDPGTANEYSKRFIREAQAAARLNHPNIVQVHDFGEDKEVAYLVMEFIQGRELRSFFEGEERFQPDEVVRLMCELLDALDLAHEAGVIHRDVKPANVILDSQRRVKLADFGVARIQDSSDRSQAGTMVGTPAYMSPEQITGGKVDRRTDIFSSGVILYELLTGKRPFTGSGAWTVAKQIVQDEPALPSKVDSTVGPVFDAVIGKALSKNADNRFARAKDFAAELRRAIDGTLSGTKEPRSELTRATAPPSAPQVSAPEHSEVRGDQKIEMELEFWRSIKDSNNTQELELFLKKFRNSTYAELAQLKLERLRVSTTAIAKAGEERAREEAAAEVRRETDEKVRQAQDLSRLKQQQESVARARTVVDDAAAIIGSAGPAAVQKKSLAIIAMVAAAVVGIAAYLLLGRTPAHAPVAEVPPAQAGSSPVAPPVDVERIRRETEERVSKEFAEKAAVERAKMEKAVVEKIAAEKASAEKLAKAKTVAEKAEAEKAVQKAEAERIAVEKAASEKAAVTKAATEKAAAERTAADKAAAEKFAAEKAAVERASLEKAAAENAAIRKAEAGPGISGTRQPSSRSALTIEITQVPPWGGGSDSWGTIAGKILGAIPAEHRVVIYARTNVWWVQPWADKPFTSLRSDGSFQTGIHLGHEYAVLLVDKSARPLPTLADAPEIGNGVLAISRVVAGR